MPVRSKHTLTKRADHDFFASPINGRNKKFIHTDLYPTPSAFGSGNNPDLALYPAYSGTAGEQGQIEFYIGGVSRLNLASDVLHLDETAAAAATLEQAGGVRLGTAAGRFGMLWMNGFQICNDDIVPKTWEGRPAFGHASINLQSVAGAAQTLTPGAQLIRLAGTGGAVSVLKVAKPPGDFPCVLTIIFDDANVTMTDSGTGGVAETMNLNGGNYVSSVDGTLRLLWNNNPVSGNGRWIELSRTSP